MSEHPFGIKRHYVRKEWQAAPHGWYPMGKGNGRWFLVPGFVGLGWIGDH